MTKTTIKLPDGTIIEINGSPEEIQRILSLYLDKNKFNHAEVTTSEESEVIPEAKESSDKMKSVLTWAKSQVGKYVQPCGTPGCKYNLANSGAAACRTPNPSADSDDIEKENEENYHPFWNFYCMRFVRTAFKAPPAYPKAEDMYQALKKAGVIVEDEPVVGVIVFWHWSTYGHVGIYIGDGKVVHTGVNPSLKKNGIRESPLVDITEVLDRYNHYQKPQTSYLGWAYAPESWLKEL